MSKQIKNNRNEILNREAPKVREHLGGKEATEAEVREYYRVNGKNPSRTAVGHMVRHLKDNQ